MAETGKGVCDGISIPSVNIFVSWCLRYQLFSCNTASHTVLHAICRICTICNMFSAIMRNTHLLCDMTHNMRYVAQLDAMNTDLFNSTYNTLYCMIYNIWNSMLYGFTKLGMPYNIQYVTKHTL